MLHVDLLNWLIPAWGGQKDQKLFGGFHQFFSNMWPLTRKRSLRFAVFAQISVCISCISRAHGLAIRAIGSGYPCQKNYRPCARLGLSVRKKLSSVHMASAIRAKKNCVRAHGSGYPCEKKFHPFEQLRLSVRKIMSSVPTARAIPSKQSRISNEPFATWSLGQESRNKPVKNVNNFVQALC